MFGARSPPSQATPPPWGREPVAAQPVLSPHFLPWPAAGEFAGGPVSTGVPAIFIMSMRMQEIGGPLRKPRQLGAWGVSETPAPPAKAQGCGHVEDPNSPNSYASPADTTRDMCMPAMHVHTVQLHYGTEGAAIRVTQRTSSSSRPAGSIPAAPQSSGRRRPTGGDGGARPEMGIHSVFTPAKRDPGCSNCMDLGWDALNQPLMDGWCMKA